MDLHIDDFYKDCANILLILYHSFPRLVPIYVIDVIGEQPFDEFGLPNKRHQSCLGTMHWLGVEGYITFENSYGFEAIEQATLTSKGFTKMISTMDVQDDDILGMPASIVRVRSTFAYQLRKALKQQECEQVVFLMRFFLIN